MDSKRVFLGVLLILPVLAFAQADPNAESDEIVIVVNAESPFGAELPAKKLRDIFLTQQKFEGKTRLSPLNSEEGALFSLFLKKFLNIDRDAYQQWLMLAVYSKGGQAPKSLANQEVLLAEVARNKGAVGYVWKKSLPPLKGVRVLTVTP